MLWKSYNCHQQWLDVLSKSLSGKALSFLYHGWSHEPASNHGPAHLLHLHKSGFSRGRWWGPGSHTLSLGPRMHNKRCYKEPGIFKAIPSTCKSTIFYLNCLPLACLTLYWKKFYFHFLPMRHVQYVQEQMSQQLLNPLNLLSWVIINRLHCNASQKKHGTLLHAG